MPEDTAPAVPAIRSRKPEFAFVECETCKNLQNFTLIEGFPGMGLVGTIAAKYLIETLGLNESVSGHIESDAFMPVVRIHKGLPVYPARFYVDRKRKLAIIISEQIIQTDASQELAQKTVDWIREKKIKSVISLAGVKTPEPKANEVYGIASNEKGIKELKKYKITVIEEGITTGVTAMILTKLKQFNDVTAFSLLADVKYSADYQAAALMLTKLSIILNLKIDIKPLLKEAKKAEESLVKHFQDIKETEETLSQMGGEKIPMTT